MRELIGIIGAVGIGVVCVFYALLYAERQGWTNPLPSREYGRAMLRDTHVILVLSVVLALVGLL